MVETEKKNKSGKKKAEKAQQRRQNNNTFEMYPSVECETFDDDEGEVPQT